MAKGAAKINEPADINLNPAAGTKITNRSQAGKDAYLKTLKRLSGVDKPLKSI